MNELLVCPREKGRLTRSGDFLVCSESHRYRIVDEIPILLRDDVPHPHWAAVRALESSPSTLLAESWQGGDGVHPFVQRAIAATNGHMYKSLVGKLEEYPIPAFPLTTASERPLLEIGCNWGRWCIAAARAGFLPVGIDPSYEAVHTARAVARQLGMRATFIVAEGRHLPFPDELFDTVFSYSVLQHLPRGDVHTTLSEVRRTLAPGGIAIVQMPNRLGLRSFYHLARRGFREGEHFEVRYWAFDELRDTFERRVGPTELEVDGFFSLNAHASDAHVLPLRYQLVVAGSEQLRRLSRRIGALRRVADSLYVISRKE